MPKFETPQFDAPQPENVKSIEKERSLERKRSNGRLKNLFLAGTLFLGSGAWIGSDYVMHKPKWDAEAIEKGQRMELTLESKTIKGKQAKFAVQKQSDGTVVMDAVISGGPEVKNHDANWNYTTAAGDTVRFILPGSTEDIQKLGEELDGSKEPGQVIEDYRLQAEETRLVKFENTNEGVRPKTILTIVAKNEDHPASATEETFDEHRRVQFTKISFNEAEGQVRSVE